MFVELHIAALLCFSISGICLFLGDDSFWGTDAEFDVDKSEVDGWSKEECLFVLRGLIQRKMLALNKCDESVPDDMMDIILASRKMPEKCWYLSTFVIDHLKVRLKRRLNEIENGLAEKALKAIILDFSYYGRY